MRKLALNKTVLTELQKLPPRQYRQVVGAILDLLAEPVPATRLPWREHRTGAWPSGQAEWSTAPMRR